MFSVVQVPSVLKGDTGKLAVLASVTAHANGAWSSVTQWQCCDTCTQLQPMLSSVRNSSVGGHPGAVTILHVAIDLDLSGRGLFH